MSTKKTGNEILAEQMAGWGNREVYGINPIELKTLLSEGASSTIKNRDNKDGTFYNEVTWQGQRFASSTTEII